ncbi:MAG: hypothetical protein LBQ40_04665 [Clostridiales bacterium]|jgi:hypothetical protein|nr:hypothetical protein [Clostridiales bacterium]
MKKLSGFVKKLVGGFFSSGVICIFLLAAALLFDFLWHYTPTFEYSLRNIGRLRVYDPWDLELAWLIITGAAIVFNIFRMYVRTGFSKTLLGKLSTIALAATGGLGVYACTLAYELMFGEPLAADYRLYSGIFIIAALACFLIGMLRASFKSVKYTIVTLIYILAIGLHYYNATIVRSEQILDNLPVLSSIILAFFLNFADFFKIKPRIKKNKNPQAVQ